MQSHAQPLVDDGPAGLPVVYAIPAGGFDIVVNGDHLLSWGIEPVELQDAAMRNLATWAADAPWTNEVSGDRRLISSDTGDGLDAVRILRPTSSPTSPRSSARAAAGSSSASPSVTCSRPRACAPMTRASRRCSTSSSSSNRAAPTNPSTGACSRSSTDAGRIR